MLRHRQLQPVPFSRELLFSSMAKGEPVVFNNLLVPVRGEQELGMDRAVIHALYTGIPSKLRIRVRCGRSGSRKYLCIDELLRRWATGWASVSVTDLHIRGTNVIREIDCSRLSDFNLLAEARGAIREQEMLTMVVSSSGTFTDSHSDDPDGSNHCFLGRKLWLVWDTFLGLSQKLEDVERSGIRRKQAAFGMSRFFSVPGSRWFIVESGQTLFLPGHFTHKVITLDDYLGVGSFFVMLPSYLRTLVRWMERTPLWALRRSPEHRLSLVDQITRRVTHKVHLLAHASEEAKLRWGIAHLKVAVEEWHRTSSSRSRSLLFDNPVSRKLVAAVLNECRSKYS
jgi:hypothetical protein